MGGDETVTPMRIFIPCRHTLGDVLSGYFCPINYGRPNPKAQMLMRLRNAWRAGACKSIFAVTSFSFWESLVSRCGCDPLHHST